MSIYVCLMHLGASSWATFSSNSDEFVVRFASPEVILIEFTQGVKTGPRRYLIGLTIAASAYALPAALRLFVSGMHGEPVRQGEYSIIGK